MLSWKECLAILEATDARGVPKPFSIFFCTADQQKQTGGQIIHYEKAVWHVKNGRINKGQSAIKATVKPRQGASKWTRNIRAVDSDQIRRLNIHLILEINGQPVK